KHKFPEADELEKDAEDKLHVLLQEALLDDDRWSDVLYLLQSLALLGLQPNYYRTQNAFLEGYTPQYAVGLDPIHQQICESVARELNIALGFIGTKEVLA
ncbi:MAG: hypothetical protein AAGA62_18020, partial [Bacteroidota bacterium]